MINQRQSGRRRGRGGQRQNGGGGRGPEMGNRIDNRARGNAAQLLEKYKTLARDAQQSGDRVLAEYYLQFADHYFRVLAENRARYEEANPRARQDRYDADGEGFDGDEGDDGLNDGGDEFDAPREARQQPQRQYRDDRQDRPYRDDRNDRQERTQRDDRHERTQRDDRNDRQPRSYDDRPRRDDRPQREGGRERMAVRPRPNGNGAAHRDEDEGETALPFDALPPSISQAVPAALEPVAGIEGEPVAPPKRRGRPRKVVVEAAAEE